MPNPGLTDEQCLEAVKALHANNGVKSYAARSIGCNEKTFFNRLKRAAERGLMGYAPVLPGFRIAKTTTVRDADGNTLREFISQKPDVEGGKFNLPHGHAIKGVSAYLDASGNVQAQWVKTKEGERDPAHVVDIIKSAFESWTPAAPAIIPSADCDRERMTVYIICDWHVGLYAHGIETGQQDWDLKIARSVIGGAMSELIEQSPKSERAIILGLGDLMHGDDGRNVTPQSGNVLDIDTRYSLCVDTVVDMLCDASEAIATKHGSIEAVFKPGNHDPNATIGIRQAMRMFFRQSKHVTVDTSPDPFYWHRFGVNLIGGTHGDKAKIPDLPMIMANRRKEDWALSKTRHFHTGHRHHDELKIKEHSGVSVFTHRAPVAQDAFHAANGYLSGRSLKSFTYHTEKGSRGNTEVEIN
jgi:hypothetical protein